MTLNQLALHDGNENSNKNVIMFTVVQPARYAMIDAYGYMARDFQTCCALRYKVKACWHLLVVVVVVVVAVVE